MTAIAARATRQLKPGTRVLCLGRVSTAKQASPDKVSLQLQADATRAFVRDLGRIQAAQVEVWEDPGVSGLDADRLEEIVAACQQQPQSTAAPGYVVVYDMSRFTRLGTEAAMFYFHRLRKAGWHLRDTTLKLQGTPGAEMADAVQITVACEVAAELSRMLKRKVRPAMEQGAKAGRLQGGTAPLGYDTRDGKLVSNKDAKTVRDMFHAFKDGLGLKAVADQFGVGIMTARWRLTNPVYTGSLVWGRRAGGQIETLNAHEPIIDRKTFDACQRRLNSGKGFHVPHNRGQAYTLSGLVTCATCGGGLIGAGWKRRALRCRQCGVIGHEKQLEATVLLLLSMHGKKAATSPALKREIRKLLQADSGWAATLDHQRQELQAEKRRLIRLAAMTDDADVADEIDAVQNKLAANEGARAAGPDAPKLKAQLDAALKLAGDFGTLWAKAATGERRELFEAFVSKATLDRAGTLRLDVGTLPTVGAVSPA